MTIQTSDALNHLRLKIQSTIEPRPPFCGMKRIVFLVLLSLALSSPSQAQEPDRSKPPELGLPPTIHLPPVQRFALSNGLEVMMMEKHDVPLVQVNVLVRGGSTLDPPEESGLASMTAALLNEGAGSRNALELADAVDFLGASIQSGAGMHTTVVSLHTPLSKLDSALALLADVAIRPMFPAEELERERKARLTGLVQWRDEPVALALVLFNRVLYGTDHPYGVPTVGNEKTLRSMAVKDLQRFHHAYFRSGNATLIVVGDVTKDSILPKLEETFSRWEGKAPATLNLAVPERVEKRMVYLVDKPGTAQSVVRIGRIGVSRLTEDYFPILVLNTILGGSFTSRLNQNLREEHGYSYGAGSVFDMRPLPGPFLAGASVQTNVTDKALEEFMKELKRILQPVTDEELARGKNYLALGYPENFQSVAGIAAQLGELIVYHLPDEYFNEYVHHVLAVTKDEVARVAKKYIDPERMDIVVVGDRKQIEKPLRDLNLGPVKVLSIEDVLGKAPKL